MDPNLVVSESFCICKAKQNFSRKFIILYKIPTENYVSYDAEKKDKTRHCCEKNSDKSSDFPTFVNLK
jgi:hypothetical protein